jgi:putative zinc finger/helix-turn-helix YgiT family protein
MNCDAEMKCDKRTHHYTESGLDNIYLEDIDVCTCEKCGEEEIGIPCIPELHRLIGRMLVLQKQRLSGKEVRFLRKHAGMSAKRFTEIIAVDKSTLSRWENENQTISLPNDRLIRLVYCAIMQIPPSELKSIVEDGFAGISNEITEVPILNLAIDAWSKNPSGGCAVA